MTVVSTMTRSTLLALMMPPLRAASMLAISKVSTPASPMRFLQRVRLEGSMGSSVCRWVSLRKYCQYGFST
jgi:hypothetical protein